MSIRDKLDEAIVLNKRVTDLLNEVAKEAYREPEKPKSPHLRGVEPLLDLIAKAESGGNYNAYWGKPRNQKRPELTSMTLAQLMTWQKSRIAEVGFSAAGRYQIVLRTLRGLIKRIGWDPESSEYNPAIQDFLAVELLNRRGLQRYMRGNMTTNAFGNALAKEWAGLPMLSGPKKGKSYYAGDGVNKSHVKPEEVVKVLQGLRA